MRFLYYDANYLAKRYRHIPDINRFLEYFKVYDQVPVDRSNILSTPVKTISLFPIPKPTVLTTSFADLCLMRAEELLEWIPQMPLYVMWSGGIDSTCVLVSLLRMATTQEQQKRITVLLSESSIMEYPSFYQRHIRGKLSCVSSHLFPYLLGKKLIVTGDPSDQLFGSDIAGALIRNYGADVGKPYDRDLLMTYFAEKKLDHEQARFYLDIFEHLCNTAPILLKTTHDMLWWLNFSLKWQAVYMRPLSCVAKSNASLITKDYIRDYYIPFFLTERFQVWSMNNRDKRIKADWPSYKWLIKDFIYEFTKDADYRDNKIKRGSLGPLVISYNHFVFVDENFRFYRNLELDQFYNPDNDFTEQ